MQMMTSLIEAMRQGRQGAAKSKKHPWGIKGSGHMQIGASGPRNSRGPGSPSQYSNRASYPLGPNSACFSIPKLSSALIQCLDTALQE